MTDQTPIGRYFKRLNEIRSEMESNGETDVRHKDIHAGQIFLFEMAERAKKQAEEAEEQASNNARRIKYIMYVVGGLVLLNIENLPELARIVVQWLGS